MTLSQRARASGLDGLTIIVLFVALALTVMHHADHVLRVDHSGWPFRDSVTPFTFSLLAYPVILFALFGPARLFWLRWGLLLAATGFTLFAHTAVESPQMQFVMWSENRSLDDHGAGLHNIPDVRSPVLGMLAVAISMMLNLAAVAATLAMLRQGLRQGLRRRTPASG
jgi:hypothetical protein